MTNTIKSWELGRNILIVAIWFLCMVANIYAPRAEPFAPTEDSVVLARLAVSGDATLRMLRARWEKAPRDAGLAVALARYYLRLERAEGDPRFLGYAQAVLAPWWADDGARAEIVLIRSQILARRHAFDAALASLDRVLATKPNHPQALLSRAFILQSQGRIADAHTGCRKLERVTRSLATATCLSRMESLGGQSGRAKRRLNQALRQSAQQFRGGDRRVRLWALTNLAEIVWRRGELKPAQRLFRDALSLDPRDAYLRDAYADFLLDTGRPEEVRRLFGDNTRSDGHLLRIALAARALNESNAARHVETLASRFEENRRRGGTLHLREEARFELVLRDRPVTALTLALENWRTQREPADARLVLEASLAAGQPEKSRAVLAWLRRTKLEDHALMPLVAKIKAAVG